MTYFKTLFQYLHGISDKNQNNFHRTSWSSGYHYFVCERLRVKILALRSAILTEVFHGFPQSFQANAGIVP
jgi:hypothetical protein